MTISSSFVGKYGRLIKYERLIRQGRQNLSSRSFLNSSQKQQLQLERRLSSEVVPDGHNINNNNKEVVPSLDFDESSQILGSESQTLQVTLRPGQTLRAESGAMLFMTSGIDMTTSLGGSNSNGSGWMMSSAMSRALSGGTLFLSDYTFNGSTTGRVGLGTEFPSKIIRLSLREYDEKIICQRGAYLASSATSLDDMVEIQTEFTKTFAAGFFGGEGFILQSLIGKGDVFLKAGGTLVRRDLKDGERLRISSGSLVAFTRQIQYDVEMMKGFQNVMFGGEGLFVTTLTGPGTVWLQGMPPDRMISEIVRRIPSRGGPGLGLPIMMGGGGGGGNADDVAAGDVDADTENQGTTSEENDEDESVVAMDEDSIQADREATVATSGVYDNTDSESPSALFGDAAPDDDKTAPTNDSDAFDSTTTATNDDFDSTTTFSTSDDNSSNHFPNDDNDTTMTNDDFHSDTFDTEDNTEFDTGDTADSGDDGEGGGFDFWGTLNDIFGGGDD